MNLLCPTETEDGHNVRLVMKPNKNKKLQTKQQQQKLKSHKDDEEQEEEEEEEEQNEEEEQEEGMEEEGNENEEQDDEEKGENEEENSGEEDEEEEGEEDQETVEDNLVDEEGKKNGMNANISAPQTDVAQKKITDAQKSIQALIGSSASNSNGNGNQVDNSSSPEFKWETIRVPIKFKRTIEQLAKDPSSSVYKLDLQKRGKLFKNTEHVVVRQAYVLGPYNNTSAVDIGLKVNGIPEAEKELRVVHSDGQMSHVSLRANSRANKYSKSLFSQDLTRDMDFFKHFPGYTTKNLRKNIFSTPDNQDSYMVINNHPALAVLQEFARLEPANYKKPRLSKLPTGYSPQNKAHIDKAIKYLTHKMVKELGLINLDDISVNISRQHAAKWDAEYELMEGITSSVGKNSQLNKFFEVSFDLGIEFARIEQPSVSTVVQKK